MKFVLKRASEWLHDVQPSTKEFIMLNKKLNFYFHSLIAIHRCSYCGKIMFGNSNPCYSGDDLDFGEDGFPVVPKYTLPSSYMHDDCHSRFVEENVADVDRVSRSECDVEDDLIPCSYHDPLYEGGDDYELPLCNYSAEELPF